MFKVVPDADREEKQVAGVDYAVTLSVLDTTLSAIEEADVRAVTYHTPSAVAAIVSGDQADALEGLSFSGTGVSAGALVRASGSVGRRGHGGEGRHSGRRRLARGPA